MTSALIFPGQGSQSVGMLNDLALTYPEILQTFSEASECLDYDVWNLIQTGPVDKLNQTEFTQVAMLCADIAIFRLLSHQNIHYMAGHSLGEYAALVAANAMSLKEAIILVSKRGQLMQETVPHNKGAMAAIVGLDDDKVKELCNKASSMNEQVTAANYNAVGQVVVAGHTNAVHKVIKLSTDNGAKLAMIIPVSVPCHCSLLKEAALKFRNYLAATEFRIPSVKVISNVDLSIYQSAQQIRDLLEQQLYSPVRWVETIKLMHENGIRKIVECGPGKVLSGLVKRIERSIKISNVSDQKSLEQALEEI